MTGIAILNPLLIKISNLRSPALYFNGHKNVAAHEHFLMKILNFEPEDGCNSAPDAARVRISSRKKAETQFSSIGTRMIYLSKKFLRNTASLDQFERNLKSRPHRLYASR